MKVEIHSVLRHLDSVCEKKINTVLSSNSRVIFLAPLGQEDGAWDRASWNPDPGKRGQKEEKAQR